MTGNYGGMTDKQVAYISRLMRERDLGGDAYSLWAEKHGTSRSKAQRKCGSAEGSELIEELIDGEFDPAAGELADQEQELAERLRALDPERRAAVLRAVS